MRTLLKSLLLLLLVPWGLSSGAPLPGDELPTVEELRAHLRDYHKNFVTFRVRYRVEWPTVGITKYHDFLMTDTKDYRVSEERIYPDKPAIKSVRGGNSQIRFQAGYNMPDKEKGWVLRSIHTEPRGAMTIGEMMAVQPFYLMIRVHPGKWFDEYRFYHDVIIHGKETIDDESCIKVEVNLKDEGRVKHESRVGEYIWFAPEKDFLIKKITPIKGKTYSGGHYYCYEYRHDGERWYPFRGIIGQEPDGNKWEVVLFEVNKPVPVDTFLAPLK